MLAADAGDESKSATLVRVIVSGQLHVRREAAERGIDQRFVAVIQCSRKNEAVC